MNEEKFVPIHFAETLCIGTNQSLDDSPTTLGDVGLIKSGLKIFVQALKVPFFGT